MQLGRINHLEVLRLRDNGAYLGEEGESGVLLPKSEMPENIKPGDIIEVFAYKDSEDRPIVTTVIPPIEVGSVAVFEVSQVTDIGAFLDWGLAKELFLPFKEQTHKVREGERIPVILYIDKSERLAASMHIYSRLSCAPDGMFKKNDKVSGIVYEVKKDLGAFIAVSGRYFGMIPRQELYDALKPGETVSCRVLKVRQDGKLDLSGRKKAYAAMKDDSQKVLDAIKSYDGILPFNDKASPEQIKAELGLSKAAFKRAVGHLLKEGKITIGLDSIFIK